MNRKILIAEDERGIRENLEILLQSKEYVVETANNGFEAVKKAREFLPDLIICDIMMPDMDGYEVLKTLHADKAFILIPFIFLTAKVERADLRKGMNLGADDYLFKPYDAHELLHAVSSRLNKFEMIKAKIDEKDNPNVRYSPNDKILFRSRDHSVPVTVSNIIYISAEREYSNIHVTGQKRYVIKKSLTSWENELPRELFVRIHRSVLVNLNFVRKIEKDVDNHYKIFLTDSGKTIEVSRRYYKNLKTLYD